MWPSGAQTPAVGTTLAASGDGASLGQPVGRSDSGGLPALGDDPGLSMQQERALGDRIARELWRDPAYVDDPTLAAYVQSVWQPLRAAARARGDLGPELDERFAWRVLLARERSVNAFALPGGYLGVHLGLLAAVDNRDELAAVLGHELSHVTQRHIARMVSRNDRQGPWFLGALILGALAASRSPEAGNALMAGSQAVALQGQLNFSRDMEREADRIGLAVMTQAGFAPQGAVGMFDKLQQAARLNDRGAYPYLRTHPLTTERVADMALRLQALPAAPASGPRVGAPPPPPAATALRLHTLMKARAAVLADLSPDALRAHVALGADGDEKAPLALRAARRYAAALAALRLRDVALARQHWHRLESRSAEADASVQQAVQWLHAEIDLAAKDLPPLGVRAWFDTLLPAPTGTAPRPVLVLAALAALQARAPDLRLRVLDALQAATRDDPADALLWEWQAGLWAQQGERARALRAEAESRGAILDDAGAVDRLRAALDMLRAQPADPAADHIEASIIQARLRHYQDRLAQQAAVGRAG